MAARKARSTAAAAAARNRRKPAEPAHAEPVSAAVAGFTSAAQSPATTKAYAGDLRHFRLHGGKVPATPQMVANYAQSLRASWQSQPFNADWWPYTRRTRNKA